MVGIDAAVPMNPNRRADELIHTIVYPNFIFREEKMPYTPMLMNFSKATKSNGLIKQIDLPIVFKYANEADFFDTLSGWASHNGFNLTEQKEHYLGFAAPAMLGTGVALLASWNNGEVSLYLFACDKYSQLVKGEYKVYLVDINGLKKKFKTLFELFQLPV